MSEIRIRNPRPKSDNAFTVVMSGVEQRTVELAAELCEMKNDSIIDLVLSKLLTLQERRNYRMMVDGRDRTQLIAVSSHMLARLVVSGARNLSPPTIPAMAPVDARILTAYPVLPESSRYSLVAPNVSVDTKPFPLMIRKVR